VVFITLLIIFEAAAYIATTPRPQEQFFQLYVLGAQGLAADYYPNDNPNLRVGDLVHWFLGVSNFMGSVQLVELRVKLGNQTIAAPNDQPISPSEAPMLIGFTRFLQDNETWQFPLSWSIARLSSDPTSNTTQLLLLNMNNQTIPLTGISARSGYNFRVIIELWVWDTDVAQFQYGWFAGTERRAAWLQLWFNATSTSNF
jgi:uncharacterized membrane protein